jgi:hypothetical protein
MTFYAVWIPNGGEDFEELNFAPPLTIVSRPSLPGENAPMFRVFIGWGAEDIGDTDLRWVFSGAYETNSQTATVECGGYIYEGAMIGPSILRVQQLKDGSFQDVPPECFAQPFPIFIDNSPKVIEFTWN